jgi:hemerythrin
MGVMYVQWDDCYSVGIELLDKQHKDLFDFTNELYTGCRKGETAAREHFIETLHATVDYVTNHFSTEERMMEKTQYPDTAKHKKEHADFVKKVMESQKELEEGKRGVAIKFVQFLKDWIVSHIAVCDKTMAEYFNRQTAK